MLCPIGSEADWKPAKPFQPPLASSVVIDKTVCELGKSKDTNLITVC